MQTLYRIEFFDRQFAFVSKSVITAPVIDFDYLTLSNVAFTMPEIGDMKELFARVLDNNNIPVYEGIVRDVKTSSGISTVQVAPLLALLDISVGYDRTGLQTGYFEDFLAGVILDTYQNNADVLQNLQGVSCVTTSQTRTTLNTCIMESSSRSSTRDRTWCRQNTPARACRKAHGMCAR